MAVDGVYNVQINAPMGARSAKLTLKTDGGSLSGTLSGDDGESSFEGGTVSGDQIEFSTELSTPMGKVQLDFKCTVTGDAISGQVQAGSFGAFSLEGSRA